MLKVLPDLAGLSDHLLIHEWTCTRYIVGAVRTTGTTTKIVVSLALLCNAPESPAIQA